MGWNVEIKNVLGTERGVVARFLGLLAKIEGEKEYAELGYSSLNEYCLKELGLCEGEAWNRICAARVAVKYPQVLELIAEGRVTLTAVRMITPVLGETGEVGLLEKICGKTTREVDRIVAGVRPRKDCGERVTVKGKVVEAAALVFGEGCANRAVKTEKRDKIAFVTEARVRVEFSAQEGLAAKIERAKVVAKAGSIEEVLEKALEEYLERHDPARKAARNVGKGARGGLAVSETGKIVNKRKFSAAVRHTALVRSGGRCEAVGENGRRCEAKAYLEFDHVKPWARGGRSTGENCRVLCRTHNVVAAEKVLGREVMAVWARWAKKEAPASHVMESGVALDSGRSTTSGQQP